MIDFEGYYSFPADQVEYIYADSDPTEAGHYLLQVTLRSGRGLRVFYQKKADRDSTKRFLCDRISSELRSADEQILNRLLSVQDTVRRVDGRQLRIWRQLKRLLHIEGLDGGEAAP